MSRESEVTPGSRLAGFGSRLAGFGRPGAQPGTGSPGRSGFGARDGGLAARVGSRLGALGARLAAFGRALREVFYGATGYEFERQAARVRGDLENLFIFMLVGDMIGVPILPPYYALRLVPYLLDVLPLWQRRVLRERHPLESEEFDLHGI